mgnify:CR=1 FL=1
MDGVRMEQVPEQDRQQSLRMQYERIAEDMRSVDRISWELPSVAVAIMTGIVAVSYYYLTGLIRFSVLFLGGFFLLTLTIANAKNRFMMDVKTRFLQQIERELRIQVFPTTTKESIIYIEEQKRKGSEEREIWLLNLFKHQQAGIWLLHVLFMVSIFVFILAGFELGSILGNA